MDALRSGRARKLAEIIMKYEKDLDYSQGLSHVVALLLMWLSEEDTFWALVQLMEDSQHMMHGEGGCVPLGNHYTLVFPVFSGWESLLKMSRDHLREFLQVTLKQVQSLDDDVVIRQLRASMHELGKLQCLLPPKAKPMEDCSPVLQVPPDSLEHAPLPVSLKLKTITEESKGCHPIPSAPQGPAGASASVPEETIPLGFNVQANSKEDAKEGKGSHGKSSTQFWDLGSSAGASGSGGTARLSGHQCSRLDEPGPL
ncbi:TBC1 domain family member 3B isoform X2 [Oryctolagus cuniculus]|uniref:TBC1 domain family member 3B isoform X2 n=1 Tax=Oryctolagus cuniculus TaxID=9986 RepID=UPI00387A1988